MRVITPASRDVVIQCRNRAEMKVRRALNVMRDEAEPCHEAIGILCEVLNDLREIEVEINPS